MTSYSLIRIAGSDSAGVYSSDGALAKVMFNNPQAIVSSKNESIYVCDTDNHCIISIEPSTLQSKLFAGQPRISGFLDGTLQGARFNKPSGIAIHKPKNGVEEVFVCDTLNGTIRKIVGSRVTTILSAKTLSEPIGITCDRDGTLFVSDRQRQSIYMITNVNGRYMISHLSTLGQFMGPTSLALVYNTTSDPNVVKQLLIADQTCIRIANFPFKGKATRLVGQCGVSRIKDGTFDDATFKSIHSLCACNNLSVFVTDEGSVRLVDLASRTLQTLSVSNYSLFRPKGICCGWNSTFYVLDKHGLIEAGKHNARTMQKGSGNVVYSLKQVATISTLSGSVYTSGSVDGRGSNVVMNKTIGLTVDVSGNLFTCVPSYGQIKKITPTGLITTVGGSGTLGYKDDIISKAQFYNIVDVTIDSSNRLYVAEFDGRIRVIENGLVRTLDLKFTKLTLTPVSIYARNNDLFIACQRTNSIYQLVFNRYRYFQNNIGINKETITCYQLPMRSTPFLTVTDSYGVVYVVDRVNPTTFSLKQVVNQQVRTLVDFNTIIKGHIPSHMTIDEQGTLYIVANTNQTSVVLQVTPTTFVTRYILKTQNGYKDGTIPLSELTSGTGQYANRISACVVRNHKMYLSDMNNSSIRIIDFPGGIQQCIPDVNIDPIWFRPPQPMLKNTGMLKGEFNMVKVTSLMDSTTPITVFQSNDSQVSFISSTKSSQYIHMIALVRFEGKGMIKLSYDNLLIYISRDKIAINSSAEIKLPSTFLSKWLLISVNVSLEDNKAIVSYGLLGQTLIQSPSTIKLPTVILADTATIQVTSTGPGLYLQKLLVFSDRTAFMESSNICRQLLNSNFRITEATIRQLQ